MATKKKVPVTKNQRSNSIRKRTGLKELVKGKYLRIKDRMGDFLRRRPHRSFRRTYRRDYGRSLKLPGYWAFTNQVKNILLKHKKTFFALVTIYGLLTAIVVGVASQSTYTEYAEAIREGGGKLFEGSFWEIGQAGILLTAGVFGSLNEAPGDVERFAAVLLGLMIWLTTVWLLRAMVAGKKPRLRDGIYNAGSPIIPTALVAMVLAIQLLPLALAAIAYGAGSTTGLINEGIESMVFWAFEILLLTLSLYWLTSTLFALIVVTLPGMYPMRALKTAGDLVVGRRIRILLRFVWLFWLTIVVWFIVMIPVILLDSWIKGMWPAIQWVPIIPVCLLLVASISVVWVSAYTYMLYRKVVDDDAAPA